MSRSVAAFRGWETRRERDERVTVNLPPDSLPLWRRIGASFSGTPEQRSTAFLHYLHDHPGEALAAAVDAASEAIGAFLAHVEEETEAERVSARLSVGAVQVAPGVWSLDPRALVELAEVAGDGAALAFVFPRDDDSGETDEVTADATWLLDADERWPADSWTVEVRRDGLAVFCTMGPGFLLSGGSGDVRAAVPLPAELPQSIAYDSAAE